MKKALGITAIILALAVTAVLLRPRTVRAQSGCNVGALAGTYGYVMQGNYYYSVQGILHTAFLSSGGVFAFDGGAGLAGVDTVSDDGTILKGNLNGSYTVNSDCTGTINFTDTNKYTFNFNFVIVNGGREIDFVETDAGNMATGTAKLQ